MERFTTEEIRNEMIDYFNSLVEENESRAKHLQLILKHIQQLPGDDLELKRLATCPDLYCEGSHTFAWPLFDYEIIEEEHQVFCYHKYTLFARFGDEECKTADEAKAWFAHFADVLIEGGQYASNIIRDVWP